MNKRNRYLALLALSALAVVTLTCYPSEGDAERKITTIPTHTQAVVPTATVPQVADLPTNTPRADRPGPEPTKVPITTPEPDRPSPEPEPTNIPTEEAAADAGLKEELYYSGGGQTGIGIADCSSLMPEIDRQAVIVSVAGDEGQLCLYGFPVDEVITVNLISPNGNMYVDFFTVGADDEVEGGTVIEASLWFPVGLPTGEWLVRASSTSAQVENKFRVGSPSKGISIMPDLDINPFVSHRCGSYSTGELVIIKGTNFQPNAEVPLGIYYLTENCVKTDSGLCSTSYIVALVYSEIVTTDSLGSFTTAVHIEPSDPAGYYYVFTPDYPDYGKAITFECGYYGNGFRIKKD